MKSEIIETLKRFDSNFEQNAQLFAKMILGQIGIKFFSLWFAISVIAKVLKRFAKVALN